jgi:predicted transcriptional regulator
MINRDKYLIMRNILNLLSSESRSSTRIIYACRISNDQHKNYLGKMIDMGLVHLNDGRPRLYTITGKGMELLEVLTNIHELCPFIVNEEPYDRKHLEW